MRFLYSLLLLAFLASCSSSSSIQKEKPQQASIPQESYSTAPLSHLLDDSLAPFYHGVASGDPEQNSVVLWTKLTPEVHGEHRVNCEVSTTRDFSVLSFDTAVVASRESDYIVKFRAQGLEAGQAYFYRFRALGSNSRVGQTKTLPTETDQLRMAIISCSNYEAGYFNALKHLSQEDIDIVLHLGDYIYEYGPGVYGDSSLQRRHLPAHEIVSLEDYRTRYSQYRLDPDFQAVHARFPFIQIWDDHEISNNSYVSGAQNHQSESEGDYEVRKEAARQAYYEWIPITDHAQHYRNFEFGQLVHLSMLDERLAGRTRQLKGPDDPLFESEKHRMLGKRQLDWFLRGLEQSKASWKIVGNQVIFSDLFFNDIIPGFKVNMDAWDGYPYEKKRIIDEIEKNNISGVIFVTGDTHCSWAFETPTSLEDYAENGESAIIAHEFGTPSVSSSNWDERAEISRVKQGQKALHNYNPHLFYSDLMNHGYLLLDIRPDRVEAIWKYVSSLKSQKSTVSVGKKVLLEADSLTLKAADE